MRTVLLAVALALALPAVVSGALTDSEALEALSTFNVSLPSLIGPSLGRYATTGTSYPKGSLSGILDIAASCRTTAGLNGFDIDRLKTTVQSVTGGGSLNLMTDALPLVTQDSLPLLVLAGLGVITGVLFVLIGILFGCCRCCGHCGGDRKQTAFGSTDYVRNTKCFIFGLFVSLLLFITGVLILLGSYQRNLEFVPSGSTLVGSLLSDSEEYVDNTLLEVGTLVRYLEESVEAMIPLVNELTGSLLLGLTSLARSFMQSGVLDSLETLAANLPYQESNLTEIDSYVTAFKTDLSGLNAGLTDLGADLDAFEAKLAQINADKVTLFNDCNTAALGAATCNQIAAVSDVASNYAEGTLPDVSGELATVSGLVSGGEIAGSAEAAVSAVESELADLLVHVQNDTAATDAVTQLNDAPDSVRSLNSSLNSGATEQVSSVTDSITTARSDVMATYYEYEPYYKYLCYAGFVLLFLVFICSFGGLCCGWIENRGEDYLVRPHERSSLSNCGGNSLMCSVGIMILYSLFLWLFTVIFFIMGGALSQTCVHVKNGNVLSQIVDDPATWSNEYILGKLVLNNASYPLTVSGILADSRLGTSLYQTFQLSVRIGSDIDALYNVGVNASEVFDGVSLTISPELVSSAVNTSLNTLNDSPLYTSYDYSALDTYFSKTVTDQVLSTLASQLAAIDLSGDAGVSAQRDTLVGDMNTLVSPVNLLQTYMDEIRTDFSDLSSMTSAVDIDTLFHNASVATDDFAADTSNTISDGLSLYVELLQYIIDTTLSTALEYTTDSMGGTEPIAAFYDVGVSFLCDNVQHTFDAIWMGLGLIGIMFIPMTCFGVKLAKRFRKMEEPQGYRRDSKVGKLPSDSSVMMGAGGVQGLRGGSSASMEKLQESRVDSTNVMLGGVGESIVAGEAAADPPTPAAASAAGGGLPSYEDAIVADAGAMGNPAEMAKMQQAMQIPQTYDDASFVNGRMQANASSAVVSSVAVGLAGGAGSAPPLPRQRSSIISQEDPVYEPIEAEESFTMSGATSTDGLLKGASALAAAGAQQRQKQLERQQMQEVQEHREVPLIPEESVELDGERTALVTSGVDGVESRTMEEYEAMRMAALPSEFEGPAVTTEELPLEQEEQRMMAGGEEFEMRGAPETAAGEDEDAESEVSHAVSPTSTRAAHMVDNPEYDRREGASVNSDDYDEDQEEVPVAIQQARQEVVEETRTPSPTPSRKSARPASPMGESLASDAEPEVHTDDDFGE